MLKPQADIFMTTIAMSRSIRVGKVMPKAFVIVPPAPLSWAKRLTGAALKSYLKSVSSRRATLNFY